MNDRSDTGQYLNLFRGLIADSAFVSAALLVAATKEAYIDRQMEDKSEQRIYETMLAAADRSGIRNPFNDKAQFITVYQAYCDLNGELDWEMLLAENARGFRYSVVSSALFSKYSQHFTIRSGTVLVAESEKFFPNLRQMVDDHPGCSFTLTTEQNEGAQILKRIFIGYDNVEIIKTSIYKYGFTSNRYDFILSIPNFGMRNLVEDDNFMSRDQDSVALENLLLHTVSGGELIITMPARITFSQGKNGELRRFIQQSYKVKEISELPEGTFEGTGIKTYFLNIANLQSDDDDIIIRCYTAPKRKNRRDIVSELMIEEETFILPIELEDLGDWNITKIFSQQDEEWQKFQQSSVRTAALGGVAKIFRGKAVTKKDPMGGIGVVNISNIGEYDINYDDLVYLDEEERKVTNYLLKEGDVLIPARGTALRAAIFHEQKFPCIASSNIIIIRPDPKVLNCIYLKLFLDSPVGKKLVSGTQQGMTMISISYKDLGGLEVPIPSIEIQKKTAGEYVYELKKYQETVAAAHQRWKDTLSRLQSF